MDNRKLKRLQLFLAASFCCLTLSFIADDFWRVHGSRREKIGLNQIVERLKSQHAGYAHIQAAWKTDLTVKVLGYVSSESLKTQLALELGREFGDAEAVRIVAPLHVQDDEAR